MCARTGAPCDGSIHEDRAGCGTDHERTEVARGRDRIAIVQFSSVLSVRTSFSVVAQRTQNNSSAVSVTVSHNSQHTYDTHSTVTVTESRDEQRRETHDDVDPGRAVTETTLSHASTVTLTGRTYQFERPFSVYF